jgi:hypothetical protein
MPKDANAAADARRDPRENLIAKVLTESEKSPVSCFTALALATARVLLPQLVLASA